MGLAEITAPEQHFPPWNALWTRRTASLPPKSLQLRAVHPGAGYHTRMDGPHPDSPCLPLRDRCAVQGHPVLSRCATTRLWPTHVPAFLPAMCDGLLQPDLLVLACSLYEQPLSQLSLQADVTHPRASPAM